jgi:hypothetical protein
MAKHFVAGATYKHRHGEDVAMHVVKVIYRGDKYWKLRVKWWNIFSKFFIEVLPETVLVQPKDYEKWERLDITK